MKTILIVDDEPAARYGLRRALEIAYRIAEADSAEAAREALAASARPCAAGHGDASGEDGISFLHWMRDPGSACRSWLFPRWIMRKLLWKPETWRSGLFGEGF